MQSEPTHHFHQRRALLVQIVILLSIFLALVITALLLGPALTPPWQLVLIPLAVLFLAALLAIFAWMLQRRPTILRIGPDGIDLPIVFRKPLSWADIHRIRLTEQKTGLYGSRVWLIIDPSPGVLAPLRLPVWRKLELKFQKHHGVRIPLHGIEANPKDIVASVERFRPVTREA